MAENATDKWFIVINPMAGNGHGTEDFPRISKLLRQYDIPHDFVFTEHRHHATELTVEAVRKGYRRIVAAGGDGTLNEVVNGLFIQKEVDPKQITLGIIAVGTGNDWCRTFGLTPSYTEAIKAIKEEHTFLQDVGIASYTEARYEQTRYFANVAGLGFDSAVIDAYNRLKMKGKSGRWMYVQAILGSFFRFKSKGVRITADDREIYKGFMFSIAAGICKYNGGGIMQLPNAVADDGLLDVTLIKPIHWWNIIFRLQKLANGAIYDIGHVIHAQCRTLRIESLPEMNLETDGEYLGETPVEITALHRAIRVVVPSSFDNGERKEAMTNCCEFQK